MLTGLLLAAGRGKRMGGTKQLVLWPSADGQLRPLIAAAFDAIAPVCDELVLVLGHEAEQIESVLAPRKFKAVYADPDEHMFDSIRTGLTAIGAGKRVLLQLGDHPQVQLSTLHALINAADQSPTQAILPTLEGKGGHPIILPENIVADLLTVRLDGGLKSYSRSSPDSHLRIEVADAGIHCDIDTPDDLQRAQNPGRP